MTVGAAAALAMDGSRCGRQQQAHVHAEAAMAMDVGSRCGRQQQAHVHAEAAPQRPLAITLVVCTSSAIFGTAYPRNSSAAGGTARWSRY